ncbi:hypothetical protein [Aureispira anguillae]|uniref:Uncharacterized protein n=1 Tax=Aureispira anguillae TaxID=2864201 RepID=A0A915YGG0_9BACT|nr:hypothetical protein [Aureispira anguillae]BDS12513.1 hypothetical protein AsAng_0032360 [Aureispira anguillae]
MKQIIEKQSTSTEKSQHLNENTLRAFFTQVTETVFMTDDLPNGTSRGTWASKGRGEEIFAKNDYDFKDSTPDNCEALFETAYNGNMKDCAMISFLHTGITPDDDKTFEVILTLKRIREAHAEDDGGLDGHREWFFDHVSGYATGENISQTQALTEYPERGDAYDKPNDASWDINYSYEPVLCEPGKAVGFVTRGYEKDSAPIGTDRFENTFKDWIELMWDFGEAITLKKYKDFVFDVVTMLFKALPSNEDDPMTPVITAFSHEACQFIGKYCNDHKFHFSRRAVGMETLLVELDNVVTPDWENGDYAQLLQPVEDKNGEDKRHYILDYEVKVYLHS